MFRRWDLNGDGAISADELGEILAAGGMSRAQVSRLFDAADANHDGQVDFAEFVDWLYHAPEAVQRAAESTRREVGEPQSDRSSDSARRQTSRQAAEPQSGRRSEAPRARQGRRADDGEPEHPPSQEGAEDEEIDPSSGQVRPCPNCARTFNPRSLEIHMRSCGGSHGTSSKLRSALPGATRKQRDAAAALDTLLRTSAQDDKLATKMRATFQKLDNNSNGALERGELEMLYQVTSIREPPLDELIAKYDANHDGVIQFPEFERLVRWVMSRRK